MGSTAAIIAFVTVIIGSAAISIVYFSLAYDYDEATGETLSKKELKKRKQLRRQNDVAQKQKDLKAKIMLNLEKAAKEQQDSTKLLGQYRDLIYQTRRLKTLTRQSDEVKDNNYIISTANELEIQLFSKAIKDLESKNDNSNKVKQYLIEAQENLNSLYSLQKST